MAKENIVFLHGQVQIPPKIYINKEKELTKAIYALKTIRRPFFNGQLVANKLFFDCPVIYTKNTEMIELSSTLALGDMVDIRGVLCTQEVIKTTICGECSHKNSTQGNMVYVVPVYICRREKEISPEQGLELLKQRSEVSNVIMVIGTLCRDPDMYTNEKERSSAQYQLAVNRRYRIKEDPPEVRTDYPWVKTHGPQSLKDAECLKTGSVVYINGSLQTRDVVRTTVCEKCGNGYTWNESAMEIVPFSTEYLAGCLIPEPTVHQAGENNIEEGELEDE
jgi:hypothetical protein